MRTKYNMSKKLNKNKFLPLIKLKYYILPDKSEKHEPSGISCCICLKKNIVNVAGVFYNEDGKTHHICEDCAVHRYKEENNFNSFKIAPLINFRNNLDNINTPHPTKTIKFIQ